MHHDTIVSNVGIGLQSGPNKAVPQF